MPFLFFLSSKMTFPFYPWGLVPGRNFPWLSLKNGWLLSLYSYRTLTITSLWDIDNKISVMQMLYCPARCERLRTKNRHYINVWMSEMWTMQQSVSIHPWRVEGQEVIQVSSVWSYALNYQHVFWTNHYLLELAICKNILLNILGFYINLCLVILVLN